MTEMVSSINGLKTIVGAWRIILLRKYLLKPSEMRKKFLVQFW
jgi:hypothetical protein